MKGREEVLALIRSAYYSQPTGTAENAWNDACQHIEEGLSRLAGAAQPPAGCGALLEFFKWAMREGPWEGGDLDGLSIQDKAESLGLIVRTKFDPAKHGTAYGDFSEGDDYYEFAPGLSPPATEGK